MKKYFIVLILGLLIGMLFAKSVYGQENYFTPMTALQANQESKKDNNESKEESSESKALFAEDAPSYYYYEQYYVASDDLLNAEYALEFQNTKYSDVEFTLTYVQHLTLYDSVIITGAYIDKLMTSMEQNIVVVRETINYCRLMKYEDQTIQSLINLDLFLYNQYTCIGDYALKYLDAYKIKDFASCIKYILQMENVYWKLYIQLCTLGNPDGTSQVSFTYTTEEELEQEIEQIEDDVWWR